MDVEKRSAIVMDAFQISEARGADMRCGPACEGSARCGDDPFQQGLDFRIRKKIHLLHAGDLGPE